MVKTKQKQALPNTALYACSVAQSRPTLCDPLDCSPPGCSVHGIFQTRLEWVAIFFPRGSPQGSNLHLCVFCVSRLILYQ